MPVYRWKTLMDGMKSSKGDEQWTLMQWKKLTGDLMLCSEGFHASSRIIDAMMHVYPAVIARVEVRGDHIEDEEKECWSEMRVVNVWPWTANDGVALDAYVAELVLGIYERAYPDDMRPRRAIQAAKTYIENPRAAGIVGATVEASRAAGAAWAAAEAAGAAWAAKPPAGAASEAVRAAMAASGAAAKETILNQCENFIMERLKIP